MTGKERAALRSEASTMETVLTIGKDGITDNVIDSAKELFNTHELIKCKVLENSLYTAREACDELSVAVEAEPIQVIGSKFVLYKKAEKKEKDKKKKKK